MTATMISLLAVTLAFSGLVLWVFWPSRRQQLEDQGRIPFADEEPGEPQAKGPDR